MAEGYTTRIMATFFFTIFRRFWVKEPRHSEKKTRRNLLPLSQHKSATTSIAATLENCYLYRSSQKRYTLLQQPKKGITLSQQPKNGIPLSQHKVLLFLSQHRVLLTLSQHASLLPVQLLQCPARVV